MVPGAVHGLGEDLAAVAGVTDRPVGGAGERLVIGDGVALAFAEGDADVLGAAGRGLALAVHAAQEVGVGLRLHRRVAALPAGLDAHVSEAAPLGPGLGLLLGQTVVIFVVPGGSAQVPVPGDLVGRAAGAVGAGDGGDDVLVEPVPLGVLRGAAADVLREAVRGVGLRGGQGGPVSGRGRVVDVDLAAVLVGDRRPGCAAMIAAWSGIADSFSHAETANPVEVSTVGMSVTA